MLRNSRGLLKGFTLIELLIVLVILGILATVGLTFFTSAQMRGRDSRRKSDLKEVTSALELYYSDYGAYPASSNGRIVGCPAGGAGMPCPWDGASEFKDSKTTYMRIIPSDPSAGSYYYRTVSVGGVVLQGFQIYANLENTQDINCLPPNCSKSIVPVDVIGKCGSGPCNFAVTSANVSPTD